MDLERPFLGCVDERSLRILKHHASDPPLPVRPVSIDVFGVPCNSPGSRLLDVLQTRGSSDSMLPGMWRGSGVRAEMRERYRLLAKGPNEPIGIEPEETAMSPGYTREEGRSSDIATILVILKAFVGGTMLVLPASLLQTGLITGNLTLWAVGLLELWCMLKLFQAHQRRGGSFGQLAHKAVGAGGAVAVEGSIVLSQLGFTAAEMIYVAKSGAFVVHWASQRYAAARAVFGDASEAELEPKLIWLQLLVAVPVSWYRELSGLTVFNFAGNFLILGAVLTLSAVTVHGLAEQGTAHDLTLSCPMRQMLVFAGFSVFAFEGITMVIPIYTAHKNKDTFFITLSGTIVGITLLFSAFASANVALYGRLLEPVLTLNLPAGSGLRVWVSSAFALGSLTLVFLMAFPTYEILESRLHKTCGVKLREGPGSKAFRGLVVLACAMTARFGGQQLDLFLSVVGAVGCVPLAFVYPGIIHLRLVAETWWDRVGDVVVIILGMGIMLNCIYGLA